MSPGYYTATVPERLGRTGGKDGDQLLSSLYDDSAAGPNLDAKVMVVEQGHANKRGGVSLVRNNISHLAVPRYGGAIGSKDHLAAVCQDHTTYASEGQSQLRHHGLGLGEESVESSVHHGFYFQRLPRRAM